MRIGAALVAFWKADAGVLALTHGGRAIVRGTADPACPAGRLHYTLLSEASERSLPAGETGEALARVRAECYGKSATGYEDARALADAVQGATGGAVGGLPLKNFRGWMPPLAPAGLRVWVQCVRVEEIQADGEEQPAGGGFAKSWFVVGMDLTVSYKAG